APGRRSAGRLKGQAQEESDEQHRIVAGILTQTPVLRLLQLILEDHPVACRAEDLDAGNLTFCQPSTIEDLPSPAECLALIANLGEDRAELDLLRGSHHFPEFLPDGRSRWLASWNGGSVEETYRQQGLIERFTLPEMSTAIIGPGMVHRARAASG